MCLSRQIAYCLPDEQRAKVCSAKCHLNYRQKNQLSLIESVDEIASFFVAAKRNTKVLLIGRYMCVHYNIYRYSSLLSFFSKSCNLGLPKVAAKFAQLLRNNCIILNRINMLSKMYFCCKIVEKCAFSILCISPTHSCALFKCKLYALIPFWHFLSLSVLIHLWIDNSHCLSDHFDWWWHWFLNLQSCQHQ